MDTTLSIRLVEHASPEYDETVALRYDILRKPLGLDFAEGQLAAETFDYHVACYRPGELVGCLVLTPLPDRQLKMRQVAVVAHAQRQGIGRALVAFSEALARQQGFEAIVLNARITAVPFYIGLDYEVVGGEFLEVGISHRKMRKDVSR